MEVTGARRSLDGAEAVLKLRALAGNGDLDDYFDFHLRQQNNATTTPATSRPRPSPHKPARPKCPTFKGAHPLTYRPCSRLSLLIRRFPYRYLDPFISS
jgi:hypothetical protein